MIALSEAEAEDGGALLDETELAEQLLLLFFAGHDTSSSLLTSMFDTFADFPLIHAEARKEQLELFKEDRRIVDKDLFAMPYLEACIKEQFRHRSPVPGVFKTTTADVMYGDRVVPKDTLLAVQLTATAYFCGDSIAPASQFEPRRFLLGAPSQLAPFTPILAQFG